MKVIMKATISLLILIFSNQSVKLDLDVNLISLGQIFVEKIMEINQEKNKNNTEENNVAKEKNKIIGPYETELIQEVLISIFRCKTIMDYLYSLCDFNIGLKYNNSELLDMTKKLLKIENFDAILFIFLNKINIFNFEVWLKIIRVGIEKIAKLPAISENKYEFVINYRNGSLEYIPKEKLDYYIYRNQKRIIKINELLNKLEKFIFYCFKFYHLATCNSIDDYIERFVGTTFSSLFDGLSPITFLFIDYFKEIGKNDVYMENFFIDVSNSLSKYLYRKLGFKIFMGVIKKFLGPIGLAIDLAAFSFNLFSTVSKSFDEYFYLSK